MAGFGDIVQKAFYLGVGIASYAGEKAGSTISELRSQAQKLVDEMVARGEMTAEEAQRTVNEMVNRAQQAGSTAREADIPQEPRRIEILDDAESTVVTEEQQTEELRRQVEALRQQLNEIKQQKL